MKNKNLKNILALSFISLVSVSLTVIFFLLPHVEVGLDWTLFVLPIISILVVVVNAIFPYYKIVLENKKEPEISVVSLIVCSIITIMQILVLLDNIGYLIDLWKLSIISLGFLVSLFLETLVPFLAVPLFLTLVSVINITISSYFESN